MFSSGNRKFFVLLFLFAFAAVAGFYVQSHWPLSAPPCANIAGAWSLEKSGSGLAVSWNFDAPLFHDARKVTLEIEDGNERRKIPLNRSERASTLFYAPREADVTLRLRVQPAGAGEAEKTEVIRLGPKATDAALRESSRSRPEAAVSVWRVRAVAPRSLTSRLGEDGTEVAVYVKIDPSGKVTAASTRRYGDATGTALAKIATEAALQWKLQPLKRESRNPIYRDSVIRFKFPKT